MEEKAASVARLVSGEFRFGVIDRFTGRRNLSSENQVVG
jgi:hypothetical protein